MTTKEIFKFMRDNDIPHHLELCSMITDLAMSSWKEGFEKSKEISEAHLKRVEKIYRGAGTSS